MSASRSPQRHTFQLEAYLDRCREKGQEPNPDYVKLYEGYREKDLVWQEKEDHSHDMEWDLRTTDWILAKARESDAYAQNLYAAMCNREFTKREMWPVLKDQRWSCSWRYAGGIIADMRQEGDYIDWYCSGMGGLNQEYDSKETAEEWAKRTGYVPEGCVTEEIASDLYRLGWLVCPDEDNQ
jgi:hypothetical protein